VQAQVSAAVLPVVEEKGISEKNKKSFEPFSTETQKPDTRRSSGIKET